MKLERDSETGSLVIKQPNMRIINTLCVWLEIWRWSTLGSNGGRLTAAVAALGLWGREIDRRRKMNCGERRVWWSGKSWVSEGTMCTLPLCVCFYVCCWALSLSSKGLPVFSGETPLSLSALTALPSLSASLSPALSLYPPILSHQGLLSSGLICRSSSANLIGDRLSLAWHGDELPNPFSPLAWGSFPSALVQYCTLTQQPQPQTQAQHWLWIQRNQMHPMLTVLMVLNHATTPNASLADLFHLDMTQRERVTSALWALLCFYFHRWVCALTYCVFLFPASVESPS